MRFVALIAVVGISIRVAPLSYAQHGGGHMGGGFSGHGIFSSGHFSGRGHSSHSSSRLVSGLHHIIPIPGLWKSPKPTPPSTDSFAAVRMERGDPPRRPIIGTRPPAPPFPRPPFLNSCFGHGFCSGFGFGFGSPLFCDPLFRFGGWFSFLGLTFGFQDEFFSAGAAPQDVVSGASDLSSIRTESSTDGVDPPITLLQLKNGWMYGLTDYWVEGDNLHYVTNYGGKNYVPLDLIDLGTTIRLNSERGIEFSLHTKGQSTAP